MKKEYLIVLAIIILLAIGGGVFFAMSKKSASTNQMVTNAPTQALNIFTSIKDALTKSISLACDFTDENGRHIQSYIKNGGIRANITAKTAQESGSVILKDKKIYYWNATVAMMMDMPENTVTPGQSVQQGTTENKGASTQQDVMGVMEKYKAACKPAVVDDSLFTPPSDVKFTDLSKMMIPSEIPTSAAGIPSVNYQQMMQQYQQK